VIEALARASVEVVRDIGLNGGAVNGALGIGRRRKGSGGSRQGPLLS